MTLKRILLAAVAVCLFVPVCAQTDSTFFVKGPMGRLAARLQMPAVGEGEVCPVVILCHGFTGNMGGKLFDTIAGQLVSGGVGVMRFDFNGHGNSDGDFVNMTVPNEIDDLMAVIAFIRNLPHTGDIALLGHSQGGVVAAMTAGRLGDKVIKGEVLMAPAAVLRDDALRGSTMGATYDPWHLPEYVALPSGYKLGRDYIQTALDLPVYSTAARYRGLSLVIHGMADRIVPYTYGQRFGEVMSGCEVVLVPGEDHGFSSNTGYAASVAAKWLLWLLR